MTRLEQLLQFVDEDPDDPFNLYGLALEYLKSDVGKATVLFEKLLADHENYLPTYYQAANLFESIGRREQAIAILEKGILIAKHTKELKTLRELQGVLNELQSDD